MEAGLQAFSAEMIEIARKYIKQNVDKAGNVKESNMSEKQVAGLKDRDSDERQKSHNDKDRQVWSPVCLN